MESFMGLFGIWWVRFDEIVEFNYFRIVGAFIYYGLQ